MGGAPKLGKRPAGRHPSGRGGLTGATTIRDGRDAHKLDLAARAAWLYYIAGNTQDEIGRKLNLSRQAVQRLVSLAVAEKLIKFRLDHRLADGLALAGRLAERFRLAYCDVVPADPTGDRPIAGLAAAAAGYVETFLADARPLVLAFSTGRTLKALVSEVAPLPSCPHKLVSVVGAIARDGRASSYDVVLRLAERVGGECFPMPTPVVAGSVAERELLRTQESFLTVQALAGTATATFLGIGEVARGAPLHRDGFVTGAEIDELARLGGVGEISGWAFDAGGRPIEGGTNDRVVAVPLARLAPALRVAVGGGGRKAAAIRAALRGRLIDSLVTDEATAAAILADP